VPKRFCPVPLCRVLLEPGAGCPPGCARLRGEHPRLEIDKRSASKRGYDRTWRRFRLGYLNQNPLCLTCREGGRIVPAYEIHHVVPLHDGGPRFEDWNLMGLCSSCHARITAELEGKGAYRRFRRRFPDDQQALARELRSFCFRIILGTRSQAAVE